MLNPSQQQAVEHLHGPALVLAGAGAGKTSVLTQRVERLVTRGHVHPSRMLVVTFTNKAAREMKERLAKLLGWQQVKEIWAGTFHSICCRVLRQHIEALNMGYGNNFVIYDPKDQEKTMDLTVRSLNLDPKDYQAYQLLNKIGKYKNAGLTPDEIPAGSVDDPFEIRLYRAYQQTLSQNNALDFDDLLFLTLRLLREQEEVRLQLQQRFEQILVDEYQDTNTVQFELIRLLGERHRNLFVVGDVDQSIYSFRNANFRIILRFQEDYPDARIIKLEENYRSTGHILSAANDLIQHNQERFEKVLRATRGQGEPLRFHQALNEDEEAAWIAAQIKRISETGQPFGNFAILYRTNAQSRVYEQKLIQYALPYHVVGGFRFYDRREIKDMLCYLQVIHNPQDSLSLKRILNVPKRGVGAKAVETLETSATFEGRGLTLFEAIQTFRVVDTLPLKAQSGVQFLASFLQQIRQQKLPVAELLERVFNESGYRAEVEAEPDSKKRQDRLDNVAALIQAAIEFEVDAQNNKGDPSDLGAFLEKIALFSDTDKLKDENKSISLMTVHAAKGLEFPVVFLPGVEEGIFPHIRSILDDNAQQAIEEERRLMYVAITRAKNQLFLTYASQRRNKRAAVHNRLSRFMVEIAHHMRLPGELLVEFQEHQRGERYKRMNIKGEKDLPGQQPVPAAPLHPLAEKMRNMQQQRGQSTASPVVPPTAPAAPLHPLVEKMQRLQKGQLTQSTSAAAQPLSASRPAPASISRSLTTGDRVRHPDLGIGEVQKIIPPLAKVLFPTGVKTFHMDSAPLERLS